MCSDAQESFVQVVQSTGRSWSEAHRTTSVGLETGAQLKRAFRILVGDPSDPAASLRRDLEIFDVIFRPMRYSSVTSRRGCPGRVLERVWRSGAARL